MEHLNIEENLKLGKALPAPQALAIKGVSMVAVDCFDELEVRPRHERQEYYNRKLQEQIQYAYDHATAMRARLDQVGIKPSDVRTVRDMMKIAITKKDELIDLRKKNPPFGGLLGIPREKLQKIFMSPGPIYDFGSIDASFYRRFHRAFYAAGFRKGDLVVNCNSYHMVPSGHWSDYSLMLFGAIVIPMGVGNTELQVQVLRDMQVTGWMGYPSFLMAILSKAEELGYDIRRDFALRKTLPGGEVGGAAIRKIVEEKYGIKSTDIYPTADAGIIAYECPQKSGMHIAEEILVEIIDPIAGKQLGPGEPGEVVVTPLDNTTYPLIRFGTGDLSSLVEEPCPCGRTSLKLSRILGRVGEAVQARGMFIHPRGVGEVAARFPAISKYQVSVSRPQVNKDKLVLKIELANGAIDKGKLTAEVEKTFQDICRLRLDEVQIVSKGTIPDGAKTVLDERTY